MKCTNKCFMLQNFNKACNSAAIIQINHDNQNEKAQKIRENLLLWKGLIEHVGVKQHCNLFYRLCLSRQVANIDSEMHMSPQQRNKTYIYQLTNLSSQPDFLQTKILSTCQREKFVLSSAYIFVYLPSNFCNKGLFCRNGIISISTGPPSPLLQIRKMYWKPNFTHLVHSIWGSSLSQPPILSLRERFRAIIAKRDKACQNVFCIASR